MDTCGLADTCAPGFQSPRASKVEDNRTMGRAGTVQFKLTVRRVHTAGEPFFEATCQELELTAYGDTLLEAKLELRLLIQDHFDWIDKYVSQISDHHKSQLKYRNYLFPY